MLESWHGTTILSVRKGDKVVVAGDGQVSLGPTIIKPNARKVRRLGPEGRVIGGFAGATADAFTLFERLEKKLEQHHGALMRAAPVIVANAPRGDRRGPRSEAGGRRSREELLMQSSDQRTERQCEATEIRVGLVLTTTAIFRDG